MRYMTKLAPETENICVLDIFINELAPHKPEDSVQRDIMF